MRILKLRKPILAAVTACAVAGLALLPNAAQAASSSREVGPAPTAAQQNLAARTHWQANVARSTEHGAGCYQASYPSVDWQSVKCVAAPKILLLPAVRASARHADSGPATVGDGTDFSAVDSGLISQAVGTFTNVSSNISEQGDVGGSGSLVSNSFSLQLNSQFFSGSPACSGSSDPSDCQAWQQFVYTDNGDGTGDIFMQYWLIDYSASCPSGWISYSSDCYTNSNASEVNGLTAGDLASVNLSGSAASGGNDAVTLSLGSGSATTVTGPDSTVDLASFWNTTEWGVYGDGGGSEAYFGSGNTLEAQTALTATNSSAPSCVAEGFTGETNNLNLTATPSLGSESSPTMASAQTDGSSGSASCAVAAGGGSGGGGGGRWTGQITGYNGLCLDDRSSSTQLYNPVQVYTCNNTGAQQWTVVEAGSTIQDFGMCLDVDGGGTTDGTVVDLYTCNGTGSQVWEPQSDGQLYNPQSNKCLDDTDYGGSGTQLQLWDCTANDAAQIWTLPAGAV